MNENEYFASKSMPYSNAEYQRCIQIHRKMPQSSRERLCRFGVFNYTRFPDNIGADQIIAKYSKTQNYHFIKLDNDLNKRVETPNIALIRNFEELSMDIKSKEDPRIEFSISSFYVRPSNEIAKVQTDYNLNNYLVKKMKKSRISSPFLALGDINCDVKTNEEKK